MFCFIFSIHFPNVAQKLGVCFHHHARVRPRAPDSERARSQALHIHRLVVPSPRKVSAAPMVVATLPHLRPILTQTSTCPSVRSSKEKSASSLSKEKEKESADTKDAKKADKPVAEAASKEKPASAAPATADKPEKEAAADPSSSTAAKEAGNETEQQTEGGSKAATAAANSQDQE